MTAPAAAIGDGFALGHLQFRGTSDGRSVILLGYPLRLSPGERQLVECLCRTALEGTADGGAFIPTPVLQEALTKGRSEGRGEGRTEELGDCPSADHITVLVSRINRKARDIGGRKLIIGAHHHGYRLNRDM